MWAETAAAAWTYVFANLGSGFHDELKITWPLIPLIGVGAFVWLILLICSKTVRNSIVFADGVVDPEEREWLHLTEELEAEAGGMFLSFLAANALRYYIGGILPDDAGTEEGKVMHRPSQIIMLLGAGVASALFGAALCGPEKHHDDHPNEQSSYYETWKDLMKVMFFELAGWGVLISIQWTIQRQYNGRQAGIMIRLLTAFLMTAISFGGISMKIHEYFPEDRREMLKVALTTGMAIAAGYGWERCFDDAFESLGKEMAFLSFDDAAARQACDDTCAEIEEGKLIFMMDAVSAGIAFPVLYHHIAPAVIKLNDAGHDTPRSSETRNQSDAGAGA
jgi:hypothetical protein